MTQFTRTGSYLILVLGLLLGAVLVNGWLQQQTQAQVRQLNDATIAAKQQQFRQVAGRMHLDRQSSATELTDAARSMGATIERYDDFPILPSPGLLSFSEHLGPRTNVLVSFAPPPAARLLAIYHRLTIGLLLLCPGLLLTGLVLASLVRRFRTDERPTVAPWARERAQAVGMEQFARLSNERTAALVAEHGARLRAEEDLQVNRTLLDHSVAERIRLGRNLHDNICQTLYAVCLTLESVQKKSALSPEMGRRTDQCLAELRRLNQEVRAYLHELEPGRVNGQSFATALAGMIGSLPAEDEARIERRLDVETVEQIPSHQVAEIMNILREALSNSLRHGQARHITLLAGRNDEAIALSVQDDGIGFSPVGKRGHGLGNMQARAGALGGSLHVESNPGKGTRVILTLPLPALA
jgi:signal transduction histidine kinase